MFHVVVRRSFPKSIKPWSINFGLKKVKGIKFSLKLFRGIFPRGGMLNWFLIKKVYKKTLFSPIHFNYNCFVLWDEKSEILKILSLKNTDDWFGNLVKSYRTSWPQPNTFGSYSKKYKGVASDYCTMKVTWMSSLYCLHFFCRQLDFSAWKPKSFLTIICFTVDFYTF